MARGNDSERLRSNLDADVNEDRKKRRPGQPPEQRREPAEVAGGANKDCGGQRVRGPAAHRLVRGLADVGRSLDDSTQGASKDGSQPFREQDGSRVVLIPGRGGALGTVDAADNSSLRSTGDSTRNRMPALPASRVV